MEKAGESSQQPAESGPQMRLVTERFTVRRKPGGRLALAAFLVPALLTGAGGLLGGPALEDDLAEDATAALAAEEIRGVTFEVDGQFLTAKVPTGVNADQVEQIVEGVEGVADVRLAKVFASPAEERACTDLDKKLNKVTGGQRIGFIGRTARLSADGAARVKRAANLVAACGTARVYVGGHTDSATRDGSTLTLQRARAMIAVMRKAGVPADRLLPRGYGAQYLVTDGDSAAARARNERGSIVLEGT